MKQNRPTKQEIELAKGYTLTRVNTLPISCIPDDEMADDIPHCDHCHNIIRTTDKFCPTCGSKTA